MAPKQTVSQWQSGPPPKEGRLILYNPETGRSWPHQNLKVCDDGKILLEGKQVYAKSLAVWSKEHSAHYFWNCSTNEVSWNTVHLSSWEKMQLQ